MGMGRFMVAQSLIGVPLHPLKQEILRAWTNKAALVGLGRRGWIEDISSDRVENNNTYLLRISRYKVLCKAAGKH